MRSMIPWVRRAFTLFVVGVPGVASAQVASIGGGPCTYATLQAALANATPFQTIFLAEGTNLSEGGFTLSSSVTIVTGDVNCDSDPTALPANIDGGGVLGTITIGAGTFVTFENVTISNMAGGFFGNLHVDGDLKLKGSTVRNGFGQDGGGIYVDSTGIVELQDSFVFDNTAVGNGGGVFVEEGGQAELLGFSTVWFNEAQVGGGGGVYTEGELVMRDNSAISQNRTLSAGSGHGGGIYVAATGSLDGDPCNGCSIGGNDSELHGGGIWALGPVDLYGVDMSNNTARAGGGIWGGEPLKVYFAAFEYNEATEGDGGAIMGWNIDIRKSELTSNHAHRLGGAIFVRPDGSLDLADTSVRSNTADEDGGGIAVHGDAALSGLRLQDNEALGDGGGLYLAENAEVTVTGARILRNVAGGEGGGIMVDSDDAGGAPQLTLSGPRSPLESDCLGFGWVPVAGRHCSEIGDNTAGAVGGGLAMRAGVSDLDQVSFYGNDAQQGTAIVLLQDDEPRMNLTNGLVVDHTSVNRVIRVGNSATANITYTTIANNSGPVRYNDTALGWLQRSIVWGTDLSVGGANVLNVECSSLDTVRGSGTVFSAVSPHDVGVDPMLTATYGLQAGSPAIDRCLIGPLVDLEGEQRPQGANRDRGAFESF